MAGLNKPAIQADPAITKWNNMIVNRHKYFRWTPRTSWISFIYVIVVPGAVGYLGYVTDGKYELRAKLRGNTISEW